MNKVMETREGCVKQTVEHSRDFMNLKNAGFSVIGIIFAGVFGFAVGLICYFLFGNLLAAIGVYYLSVVLAALLMRSP